MRKAYDQTRVSVRLRKSEGIEQWSLYLEAYPVIDAVTKKVTREREYLNRSITTPIWDKTRIARTSSDGKSTFKPKRDYNGIIQCKSIIDKQTCIFADKVREIRQREFDHAFLFTDVESAQAELNERNQYNFIEYFKQEIFRRHRDNSSGIIMTWNRVYELMKLYVDGEELLFSQINTNMIEEFKRFLTTAPQGGSKKGPISLSTASTYFSIFKAGLKQAFVDGYLSVDIAAKVKNIKGLESRREYLTAEELNKLATTPCDKPILKRAALFSALTGLRHSDIQKLRWSEVQINGNDYRLNFTQQKTKGVEYMPMSKQAMQLCGEPRDKKLLVFPDLPDPSWISKPLERWIQAAGITKHITFHCFRHTYATLQLAGGTDIYTVSKMLGHTDVKTTQIYTKVIDEKKTKAASAIQIDANLDELD